MLTISDAPLYSSITGDLCPGHHCGEKMVINTCSPGNVNTRCNMFSSNSLGHFQTRLKEVGSLVLVVSTCPCNRYYQGLID